MSQALLDVEGVTKRFGGFTALDDVSVAIRPGERFGLVGPNGSGKTTLINCISGVLGLDTGPIAFLGARHLDICPPTCARGAASPAASRSRAPSRP